MTDLTALSALAIKAQSAAGTYAAPGLPDLIPCANLSWRPNAITSENPEYTGTIHRNGPIVLGATYDVTFELLVRGPGGVAPPSADAFVLGRVLRSLGMTENIVSAAIPAAPEALAAGGTTTSAVLGSGAAATADLYKGLAVQIAASGAGAAGLTMIRSYSVGKVAALAETLAAAAAGNYQIPRQVAYTLSPTGLPPVLSLDLWQGTRRYSFVDMAPSSASIAFPTSSRDGTDYPKLSLTYSGDAYADVTEAAPALTPGIAVPPFKGGKLHIANLPMGGSQLGVDFGLKVGYPPNPNKPGGSDPAQLVETRRTVSMTLNQVAKAYLDLQALAKGQGVYPIQALYGLASGNYVGFIATDARFNFPEVQAGGDFFATQGDAYVDDANRSVSLVFPYY